jgi:adenylate cyclase
MDDEQSSKVRATSSLTITRGASARTKRVTVLFADLRGYTGLAESLDPPQIVPLLDEFFGMLALATTSNGGTVYHVAGDGMMAGFDGSQSTGAGAREALAAGHGMLRDFIPMAARWRREFSIETGIGVGLHLGEVAVGLLGPPDLRATTLVGDTVNVASRLCSRARAGEVLLSCTVAAALDIDRDAGPDARYSGPVPVLHLPQFALRGRNAPLDIWCVPAAERINL